MRAAQAGEARAFALAAAPTSPLDTAIAAVAEADGVPIPRIVAASSREDRRRRQMAVYLAHTQGGIAIKRLAKSVGLSPRQIRRSVHQIEDRRDDPAFDAAVARFEEAV